MRSKITAAALRAEGRRMRAEGIESRGLVIDPDGTWVMLAVVAHNTSIRATAGEFANPKPKKKTSKRGPVKR